MKWFGFFAAVCTLAIIISLALGPAKTETVCFDDITGSVIFYAAGYTFDSDGHPLIELADGVYRIKETRKILTGTCRSNWGGDFPRGRAYYE